MRRGSPYESWAKSCASTARTSASSKAMRSCALKSRIISTSASASPASAARKVGSMCASRRRFPQTDSCYNARHDLGTDGAARGVEAAVGAAAALRPHLAAGAADDAGALPRVGRSEEHTSELQSRQYLVCRLLLEKKTS